MVCSQQNILTDTIKDLCMLNLSFGSSTTTKQIPKDARSDVTESPKSSVFGQNDNSEMKKSNRANRTTRETGGGTGKKVTAFRTKNVI